MTGKFYKKSNLRISGILKLIRVWECEVGESFLDYCSFGKSNCEEFLDFLKDKYEVVYDFVTENYHEESANLDKLLCNIPPTAELLGSFIPSPSMA